MLEIPSNGPERDQAFIERSRAMTDGPSGLAMQLAEALAALLDSEARPPLVIGGRSSAKSKQVVLDGIGLVPRNLAGQRILFVGSSADEPEVRAAVEGIGGRLLHVEYGRGPDPSYPMHFGVMDVVSGGSMASADGTVSVFLEIQNTSTSTLWITTMLELPGGSQGGKVEKALAPGERQVFEHPGKSLQLNADYWISATAHGDSLRSRKLESHRLHFRFSAPPR